MNLLPLISIPVIYLISAFVKPYLQPKIPFNICAICVAVSLSWLILLAAWLAGVKIEPLNIAILMGMSLTGLMYKAENFYKGKSIRNFWLVRLIIVLSGYLAIQAVLSQNWNLLILIIITSLLLTAIASLLFQKITHKDVMEEQFKTGKDKSLIKRLEDCC